MPGSQPSLFLSHGAPVLPLLETPASTFLAGLGAGIEARHGRPSAILVASAHWETARPAVSAMPRNATIHDFHGFPAALYELRYPAPGAPELAARIAARLAAAGLPAELDPRRGLDHGAWCPLILAWPGHDIPVLQLSVQSALGPAHHLRLGAALRPLREDGVLVIGSGSWTHDLRRFRGQPMDLPETPDVTAFSAWMDAALRAGRHDDLLAYRRLAPHAADQHPTEEHLLPLFVAMGAAGEGAAVERLHSSTAYGMLRMDAYAFR